jgi:Helix-turn-helix domain
MTGTEIEVILEKLNRIEAALEVVVRTRKEKELYTVAEVAERLGKAEFTVRQWCRFGRVHARKRACGRGPTQEWVIPHEELQRLENEGLLPLRGDESP